MNRDILEKSQRWLLPGAVIISLSVYLWYSYQLHSSGFPLDDAWIHQTYARNLVASNRWMYANNSISGGSTAPLWTLLLSISYLLKIDPKFWAYLMGGICLYLTAWIGTRWVEGSDRPGLALGLLILAEWHLVWAALSGMETLAMGLISTAVLYFLQMGEPNFGWAGILIGVGAWLRPDAILLTIPLAWVFYFFVRKNGMSASTLNAGFRFLAGFLTVFIPYFIFNFVSAGTIWPTTFFAKQAEYAVLLQKPLIKRFIGLIQAPLAGVGMLLLPGFLVYLLRVIQQRRFEMLAPFLWVGAYVGAYTVRLPVSYQHGRYLIPVLPVCIILGYQGIQQTYLGVIDKPWLRIITKSWRLSIPIVAAIFWVLGVRAYGQDVAIIESEMVTTAIWVRENTPPGAIIAAHDIGAIGYYADRELLDLAGLVSPEVIPIIRDEPALKTLIEERNVDYLVTFPGWYPQLSTIGEKIYQTEGRFSPQQGGENLAVYRWP